MKYINFKMRVVAIITAATMIFSNIPVYADEQVDSVVENTEDTVIMSEVNDYDSNEETGESQDDYEGEVVELTITTEEITPESDSEIIEESENAENTLALEEATEVESEETENIIDLTETAETACEKIEAADNANDILETVEVCTQSDSMEALLTTSEQTENAEQTETTDLSKEDTNVEAASEKTTVNKYGKSNEEYKNIIETYDEETKKYTSEVNYVKELSDFRTSQSSIGRYNAEFTVVETETSTGTVKTYNYTVSGFKSIEMAEKYAKAISELDRYNGGSTIYNITDNNFIDAEKRPLSKKNATEESGTDYDLELCWAGSAADLLTLSGWNKAERLNTNGEDISDEDKLFDLYAKYFLNVPSHQYYGLEWFFNGINTPQVQNAVGWAQLKESVDADNDGYTSPMLKEYCSSDFFGTFNIGSEEDLTNTLKYLDADEDGDRCALGLGIFFAVCDDEGNLSYDEAGELILDGGHALTIVGYSTDENGIPNTITIADSDSDMYENGKLKAPASNRNICPNVYSTYPVEYYDGFWHIMNYYTSNTYDVIIGDLTHLKYYSDNTKDKLEQGGTLNLKDDYDFLITDIFLSQEDITGNFFTVYQGDNLSGNIKWFNRSLYDTRFDETPVTYRFVISKDGEIIKNFDYCDIISGLTYDEIIFNNILMDADNPLEEGEYTVSYILNYDRSIKEAYYNNNVSKIVNRFLVIKRVDENGNVDYVVVPDTSSSSDDNNNDDNNNDNDTNTNSLDIYQNLISIFMSNINEFSAVVEQAAYENDNDSVFEFTLANEMLMSGITEDDILNAEICFDYSITGNMELADGSFGGKIASNISITKNDYNIIRNADGSLSMKFTNEFMKKLPKGTHYFKLVIAGKARIFKIEVK